MPVLLIYGMNEKEKDQLLEEFADTLAHRICYNVEELKLKPSEISFFFPKDSLPWKPGREIIVFVEGLFDKPERTEEVRNRLAEVIKKTVKNFFENSGLVECFIHPFDPRLGFSSWSK